MIKQGNTPRNAIPMRPRAHRSHSCSHAKTAAPKLRDWIKRIDHAVWHVVNIDRCVDVLVERMGFPLIRPMMETENLRFADISFGALAARMVESLAVPPDPSFEGRLAALAFEVAGPLAEAVAGARNRGFAVGAIHDAASSVTRDHLTPTGVHFGLVRGVVQSEHASLTSSVILTDPAESNNHQDSESECFAQSSASHFGVNGVRFLTAEVEEEEGLLRWRRFLSKGALHSGDEWRFPDGPGLRVILGGEDRFSSATIECADLDLVARQFQSCGIATRFCCGARLIPASLTGGVALRFVGAH